MFYCDFVAVAALQREKCDGIAYFPCALARFSSEFLFSRLPQSNKVVMVALSPSEKLVS